MLHRGGWQINHKRVERIWRREGLKAPAQQPKGQYTVAYRMRNLFLDRWNLWPRLAFYCTWEDENGNVILDGTNNGCERSILVGQGALSLYAWLQTHPISFECQPPDCSC